MADATTLDLKIAFSQLDTRRAAAMTFPLDDDLRRVVRAWECYAHAKLEEGDGLLASLTGDGSVHAGDVAFVKALRAEATGEFAAIVDLLTPFIALPGPLQIHRIPLRTADALLKLRRFSEVEQTLDPLLQPPGTQGTLEAHFIVLQGMMATNLEKDRLIEQVALIDGLLEKGFRLTEAENVVFYATWLARHRIEPPIGPLLNAHATMVEQFETDNRDVIAALLELGNRHKAPAAVRSAGRNYARKPFPWEGQDPETVSYLFTSHEEHEAARQTFLLGYPKSQLHKRQELWGPLLVTTYYAGRWKEALELYREHRDEIQKARFRTNAMMVKALCEFQLKRLTEAHQTIEALGARFYDEASGGEAAADLLVTIALKGDAALMGPATKAFMLKASDPNWLNEYTTAVLTQLTIHERRGALGQWIEFMTRGLKAESRADALQRVGDMMVEWALPDVAFQIADVLEKLGQPARADLLRAFAATEQGNATEADRHFAAAAEHYGRSTPEFRLLRARCLRRLGRRDEALAELDALLTIPDYARRHTALALREGTLRENGAPREQIDALRREALAFIRTKAADSDTSTIMLFDVEQLANGDTARSYLAMAQDVIRREPDNVEALRLSRKAERAPDRTPEIETQAAALREQWEKSNLLIAKG